MSESVIPAVLLRVLCKNKFVGHRLRRMADENDHVRVELTFHKTLAVYKKRAESKERHYASSAGEWPRQPTAARRPPPLTTRPPPPSRRQPTTPVKETPSPSATQTLQNNEPTTITLPRSPKTIKYSVAKHYHNQPMKIPVTTCRYLAFSAWLNMWAG